MKRVINDHNLEISLDWWHSKPSLSVTLQDDWWEKILPHRAQPQKHKMTNVGEHYKSQ